MNLPKLIILDRDGVINHDSDNYIKSPSEWLPINGTAEAIAKLNKLGIKVGVATNQSGIGRGLFDEKMLNSIHQKMHMYLSEHGAHLDKLSFCPDHPDAAGPNRKPAPGMALFLLDYFKADAAETWFVGDSISDLLCAIIAGCKPALVLTGKGRRTLQKKEFESLSVPIYKDLADFFSQVIEPLSTKHPD